MNQTENCCVNHSANNSVNHSANHSANYSGNHSANYSANYSENCKSILYYASTTCNGTMSQPLTCLGVISQIIKIFWYCIEYCIV